MGTKASTIVAGVSELAAYDLSLRTALDLGRRSGATVHLVHAFEIPPLIGAAPGADLGYAEQWVRLGPELQAALEEVARPLRGDSPVVCHAVPGSAGTVLRDLAAETGADLVVVGAAHAGRMRQAFLGITAQRVLRAVHAPVLVVRRPLRGAPPRVLLTTDLSPLSAVVHERGLDTVEAFLGPELEAVRSLVVAAFGFVSPSLSAEVLAEAAKQELRGFLGARRSRPGHVEPAVRTGGAPAAEIVEEAAEWHADVLVVGTHARHGIDRLLLGSTAEACMRDAPCNVLAVPPLSPAVARVPQESAGVRTAAALAIA
jgi:nucleotide-binding universal stress UspA family protein